MDMDTMKNYIEDLLEERKDLFERLHTAEAYCENWYAIAEHLWRKSLGQAPTQEQLWAFREQAAND